MILASWVSPIAVVVERHLAELDDVEAEAAWVADALDDFAALWKALTPPNRYRLVHALVHEVVVDEPTGETTATLVDFGAPPRPARHPRATTRSGPRSNAPEPAPGRAHGGQPMTRATAEPLDQPLTERRGRTKVFTQAPPKLRAPEPPRPLRAARMLALAHRLQAMIEAGEVEDRASLARRLGFSRARITQLLDLLLLAPDIQEELLFTEVPPGRDPVTEHDLRKVVRAPLWADQRAM